MDTNTLHIFAEQLRAETLKSERLRALMMAVMTAVFSLAFIIVQYLGGAAFLVTLRATGAYARLLGLMLALVLYEMCVYTLLGRRIRRHAPVPNLLRYGNALLETSIPTIGMLIFARYIDPLQALISLAPYLYFLSIIMAALRLEFWLCVFTGAVAAVEYVALGYTWAVAQTQPHAYPILQTFPYFLLKGVVFLLAGICAGFVTQQIRQRLVNSLQVTEEYHTVLRLFGQHVSPVVVEELLRHRADTSTARKYVCVMFTDIRGFTTFAEQRSPEDTVAYLNSLFEFMIQIINDHHGIVHQLLGDGMMAIFGAPVSYGNDADNAVQAAIAILTRLQQEMLAGRIPPTRLGIGVHAGEVVAGTVGSALHKEYKVTGDVVNLAARLEQLNKEFNSQLLISGEVLKALRNSAPAVPLGPVVVRGREEPVEVYALVR